MTLKVIINHDEEIVDKAYGVDTNVFANKMGEIIKKYFESEDCRMSELGDLLQENLEPNEILFLAHQSVIKQLDDLDRDLSIMEKLSKKLGL
jgi:hypothetical protein